MLGGPLTVGSPGGARVKGPPGDGSFARDDVNGPPGDGSFETPESDIFLLGLSSRFTAGGVEMPKREVSDVEVHAF